MANPTLQEQMIYGEVLLLILSINDIEVKFISHVPRDKAYLDVKTDKHFSPDLMKTLIEHVQPPFLHASIKDFKIYSNSYFITILLEK